MEIIVPAVIAHGGAGPGPKRQKNLEIAHWLQFFQQ